MLKFLKDILSEKSPISSMRLMAFVALLISGYVAIRGLETHADLSGLAMLCGTFLACAFGGKVAQKSVEVKSASNTTTDIEQTSKPRPPADQ
jgi:hypothetical protein